MAPFTTNCASRSYTRIARKKGDMQQSLREEKKGATIKRLEKLKFQTGPKPKEDVLVRTGVNLALTQQACVCDLEECHWESLVWNWVTNAPYEHVPT